MCFPALPALALLAGGIGASYLGDRKAQKAQYQAFSAEQQRQRRFSEEQQSLFDDSLARAAAMRPEDAQAEAVERRRVPLVDAIAPASSADYLPGSSSAAPIVHDSATRGAERARGAASSLAQRIAELSGFNDQLFDTNLLNARSAGRIGQIGSFRAGSAGAADAEVRAAANKGAFLRGLGSIAQTIGGAMLTGGVGGAGKAAAAKVAVPAGTQSSLAQLFGYPDVSWAGAF